MHKCVNKLKKYAQTSRDEFLYGLNFYMQTLNYKTASNINKVHKDYKEAVKY